MSAFSTHEANNTNVLSLPIGPVFTIPAVPPAHTGIKNRHMGENESGIEAAR